MQLSQTFSSSFKSLNRQKDPVWANRFKKDVNDLNYYAKQLKDVQYIKRPIKSPVKYNLHYKSTSNNLLKKAMDKYDVTPYSPKKEVVFSSTKKISTGNTNQTSTQFYSSNQNPENQINIKQKIYNNPQHIGLIKTSSQFFLQKNKSDLVVENSSSNLNLNLNKLGLSEFEFGLTTIQGKIHSKNGYNVDMSKSKTNKINNANRIYYNKDEQIDFHEFEKRKYFEALGKYRNFKSYSSHNLYKSRSVGNGGMLDKYYNVGDNQLSIVKKKLILGVDWQKVKSRPELAKKPGTNLDYPDSYKELARSNSHRPLYQTQKQQQKLVFSKQVINPVKGCFR